MKTNHLVHRAWDADHQYLDLNFENLIDMTDDQLDTIGDPV